MKLVTDENGIKWAYDHYIYSASVSALAAAASLTDQVNIEADANFVIVKAAYFADLAGAVQTEDSRVIPLVRVQINDTGSGRNLQNQAVPIASLAGHEGLPLVWPVPRTFKAKSTINVTFTNFSSATTYTNVELAFIGYKKFRYSGQ